MRWKRDDILRWLGAFFTMVLLIWLTSNCGLPDDAPWDRGWASGTTPPFQPIISQEYTNPERDRVLKELEFINQEVGVPLWDRFKGTPVWWVATTDGCAEIQPGFSQEAAIASAGALGYTRRRGSGFEIGLCLELFRKARTVKNSAGAIWLSDRGWEIAIIHEALHPLMGPTHLTQNCAVYCSSPGVPNVPSFVKAFAKRLMGVQR